ncbi:MAG TPA: nicotinate (nicotinamide) nucleotide adenylyltransferase [Solirubrobacteraceae bacterium]|nr:nicotinate (nicotinamide) nucleotide adenylyltransferase [Solirubrobacteraceae bacterium]
MLGGTFNPPHAGHIALARAALQQLALDRVYLMPVAVPPHKPATWEPGAEHRVRMCELASAGEPGVEVCALEFERPGPSYTVDTLRRIHQLHPETDLTLILGADMAATFATWREPRAIASLANVAVAERPGVARERTVAPLLELAGPERTHVLAMAPRDVSSSTVRRTLASGAPIEPLVGGEVAAYIDEHELYGRQPPRVGT